MTARAHDFVTARQEQGGSLSETVLQIRSEVYKEEYSRDIPPELSQFL